MYSVFSGTLLQMASLASEVGFGQWSLSPGSACLPFQASCPDCMPAGPLRQTSAECRAAQSSACLS